MKLRKSQTGFSAFEVVLLVLLLAALALAGWLVWNKNRSDKSDKSSPTINLVGSKPLAETQTPTYLNIEKWGIKIRQMRYLPIVAGAKFYGQDNVTGATDGLNLYFADMDKAYTCDANSGETHKALFGTIQQFPSVTNIEDSTTNKPDAVATVGSNKYGWYAAKNVDECYDAAHRAAVKSAVEQYKKGFAAIAL